MCGNGDGDGGEMTGGFGGFDDREKDLPLLIPTLFLRGPKRSSLEQVYAATAESCCLYFGIYFCRAVNKVIKF